MRIWRVGLIACAAVSLFAPACSGGGEMSVSGCTLSVPDGALTESREITLTERIDLAPSGYEAYSPVCKFKPAGLEFQQPVEVALEFDGDTQFASMFWSRADDQGGGYRRLGGRISNETVTAHVDHFSNGFVANGVEYTDPADKSCTVTRLIETRTLQTVPTQSSSSGVAVFFTVDDCQGRPDTGLDGSDFIIREDGTPISSEAASTILKQDGLQVFVNLSLDMSSSTRSKLDRVIAGAKAFIRQLQVERDLPVQIGIELFAGSQNVEVWQEPTLSKEKLFTKLDELKNYSPSDANSTNLRGAIAQGLDHLRGRRQDFERRNHGGAFTTGYQVVFTDGRDTSGYLQLSEARESLEQHGDTVFGVGLEGADYSPGALDDITDASIEAPSPAALQREFDARSGSESQHGGLRLRRVRPHLCSAPERRGPMLGGQRIRSAR